MTFNELLLTDKLNVDSQRLKYNFTTFLYIIPLFFLFVLRHFMRYNNI